MKQIEIIQYSNGLIDPSPYQVREHFDPVALSELAASVKEHGIIQPLTARVSPNDSGRLELVAGERRLRAAKEAMLDLVPVIVHELSDRAAQEIVLIENLQREDLTVSEEARGYRKALDLRDDDGQPVYTQASLALKIGKPLNHITDRLKLLACPDELVKAVESREVAISTAMLVGRIPDPKAREQAAKQVLKPEIQEVPLNYEQTREMIREKFMVSLQKPGFDPEDANLVPVVMDGKVRVMGGSCVGCPYCEQPESIAGSRNSVSLGSEGKITKQGQMDLCTLPSCFRKKQDVAWKIVRSTAEAQNVRVIEGDAAREIFKGWGGGLTYDAPYVQLDEKPGYEDLGFDLYNKNNKSWRKLLKGTEVAIVIARHPVSGQRVELAEKKDARVIAKAKLKGTDAAVEIKNTEDADAARKEQRAKELRTQKIEALVVNEGLTDLVAAIERKGLGLDELDFVFVMTLEQSGADGAASMGKWLEVEKPSKIVSGRDYLDGVIKAVRQRATTSNAWMGFIVAAILCKHLKYSGSTGEDFSKLKQIFGIKDAELKRRAAAILDAGKKPKRVESGPGQQGTGSDLIKGDRTTRPEDEGRDAMKKGMKERIREWKAANPGHGVAAVADGLEIPYEVAAELCDELIDEKAPKEMTFEEQVGALIVGSHKMADLIGKTPKKDAPARKAWDAKRVKLTKAVTKAQAEMLTSEMATKPTAKAAKKPAKKAA